MHRAEQAQDRQSRFDSERVKQILQRAAIEQHRLDSELTATYSLVELEEMAAEARISPEALQAALEAHAADPRAPIASSERPSRHRISAGPPGLLARWPPALRRAALAGAGLIACVGVLVAFPIVAEVLFWTTIVAAVLLLLGASPF